MSSADIAACFPSEHDSLLGTDVESRRRSSKPFYLTRSSLETRKKEQGGLAGWWARFGEGGTIFDAFLMEASQQVGQSLLTLPWAFSLMGYGWAITSLLGLSLISMWTQHLLIALHAEYRMRLAQDKEHPRHGDEDYIASYHEVFGYLMNKWWGRFSVVIVFLALLGLTVAQIIATSSNLYLLNESLPKRTYAIICGAVFSLLSFLPTFPFPKETLTNWMRGDYANLTLVVDLTLSRIDQGFFTGTRFECNLTWLELQWGRTIGQMPSPCNQNVPPPGGNPLVAPYRFDQGR